MYLEHFHLRTPPFPEEIDPAVFFTGGGRDQVCRELADELLGGQLLVKLTGVEGVGKSLVCRVVSQRLADRAEVVLLDNPIGSFAELLRVICLDLGVDPGLEDEALEPALKEAVADRAGQGRRVVVILDNAEKIFLATLERLLRLLCELEKQGGFSLLLSGRPALDTNLEQLTLYCTGVDISAGHDLAPFGQEETRQYLRYRLKQSGLSDERQDEVFAGEAMDKIFAQSGGNPRMINILAEEALQKSCSEKSFMVLLDHVGAEEEPVAKKVLPVPPVPPADWLSNKWLWAGIALVLVLAAGWLFTGRDGEEQRQNSPVKVEQPAVTPDDTTSRAKSPAPAGEGESARDTAPASTQPGPATGPAAPGEAPAPDQRDSAQPVQSLTPDRVKQPPQPAPGPRDGDKIFEQRLRASAAWVAGAYRGEYTVQLMMLSSDQAEERLKDLLVRDEYYRIRDKLHILRKQTTPPTLFLFYGTFPTLDAARQARNRMPLFLRKHHPYALSIADALTKTED